MFIYIIILRTVVQFSDAERNRLIILSRYIVHRYSILKSLQLVYSIY